MFMQQNNDRLLFRSTLTHQSHYWCLHGLIPVTTVLPTVTYHSMFASTRFSKFYLFCKKEIAIRKQLLSTLQNGTISVYHFFPIFFSFRSYVQVLDVTRNE